MHTLDKINQCQRRNQLRIYRKTDIKFNMTSKIYSLIFSDTGLKEKNYAKSLILSVS
jgi:hypothetical protein